MTGASGGRPDRLGDLQPPGRDDYLLRRQILGWNFFLRPDCVHHVPEAVRRHHSKRFREAYELLPERRVSDAFVNVALAEIALPLLRVKVKRSYSAAELRELCAGAGLTSCLNPKVHRRETPHPRPPGRRLDRGLCAR